jgi:hypothetical protein
MKAEEGFNQYCFHIRGYSELSLGKRLETAVGAELAWRALSTLRDGARGDRPPVYKALLPGEEGPSAFGDSLRRDGLAARVTRMVAQAEAEAGTGDGAAQLLRGIGRIAAEWRSALAPREHATQVALEIQRSGADAGAEVGNPYGDDGAARALTQRVEEITRRGAEMATEADGRARALEAELSRDVARLRRQDETLAQFSAGEEQAASDFTGPKPSKLWLAPLATGGTVFVLATVIGVSILAAAAAGVVAAALMALVRWRATKAPAVPATGETAAPSEASQARPARRLPESLRNKFMAYGRALEDGAIFEAERAFAAELSNALGASPLNVQSAGLRRAIGELEAALLQEVQSVPDGFFREVDPGHVELFGRQLVKALAEEALRVGAIGDLPEWILSAFAKKEGTTLAERLRAGDGRAAARALVEAVVEAGPRLSLAGTLARLEQDPTGHGLFMHWLDSMAGIACASLALGHEMLLDPALSVVRLTVGLPAGEADSLAPVIRQRFPQAGVTLGSLPDAIEFVFDVRNLPAAALMTYELSRPHYEAANPWEREHLWHYPRGRRGEPAGTVSRPTPIVAKAAPVQDTGVQLRSVVPNGNGTGRDISRELIFPGDIS